MIDLLQVTQDGVFAALDVPSVTDCLSTLVPGAVVTVWSSVPPKQSPPFVAIGLIDAEEVGDKMPGLERHTIEIECRWRGDTRMPVLRMLRAARTALEGVALVAPGAATEKPVWRASATDREEDGITWHGVHRFDLLIQPN